MNKITLVLPDINRNKSYNSIDRTYSVSVNGVLKFVATQNDGTTFDIEVNQGDEIMVIKRFRNKLPDSIFGYVVGDQIASLRNQKGTFKTFVTDLQRGVLFVYDDIDFNSIVVVEMDLTAE